LHIFLFFKLEIDWHGGSVGSTIASHGRMLACFPLDTVQRQAG